MKIIPVVLTALAVCICLAGPANAATWTFEQKLVGSGSTGGQEAGRAVQLDGDNVIVGAAKTNVGGTVQGAAWVWTRSGTTWTEQQKLTASDAATDDRFGGSMGVAMSGDWAIVGAERDDDGGTNSGSVYFFNRSGTTWSQNQKIAGVLAGEALGAAVEMDGTTAAAGAGYNTSVAGRVDVYTESAGTWSVQQAITMPSGVGNDRFGTAVGLDGDRLIVGAHGDHIGAVQDCGSAFIYERSGTTWTNVAMLTAPTPETLANFGYDVDISGDYAIVGAWVDDAYGTDSGEAYIYKRDGAGTWSHMQTITGSDTAAGDLFGNRVGIDGTVAAVGAWKETGAATMTGAGFIFELQGGTWTQTAKVNDPLETAYWFFGTGCDVDQGTVAFGAYGTDEPSNYTGSAFIYVPEPVSLMLLVGLAAPLLARRKR